MRDKSTGLWRRMILVPFNRAVPASERIYGMDQPEWWEAEGETAGILNWAIAGLCRLMKNRKFTDSLLVDAALSEYARDANPVMYFLEEEFTETNDPDDMVESRVIYDCYKRWCVEKSHHKMSDRSFFKEFNKKFTESKRRRKSTEGRPWAYSNLKISENASFQDNSYF
jgi:putative DNA primase/helicase